MDVLTTFLTLAYEAAKAYEDHVAANGKPDSHAKAKEILYACFSLCPSLVGTDHTDSAGFASAFIDREFETKGVSVILAHI